MIVLREIIRLSRRELNRAKTLNWSSTSYHVFFLLWYDL